MSTLAQLFTSHTLQVVAAGAAALGLVSGVLGAFAVLRRQAMLGDAVSHAALPGIALAFMLTGSKAPLVLVLGAAAAGWLAALAVMGVVRMTRVRDDAALGIVLSVFFGAGLMLLTHLQRNPQAAQAGLDRFLFGQAAAMLTADVVVICVLGGLALVVVGVFWKEFKLLTFDPDFAASLGWPMKRLEILLTSLIVIAIVIGLQAVGVVLMSALIVAPAAAARQWTNRLGVMVFLSGAFGAVCGLTGAVLSATMSRLPTGPTIVLCVSAVVAVSLLLAPNRGIVWTRARQWRAHRRLGAETALKNLYELALRHGDAGHGHRPAVLRVMGGTAFRVERHLAHLQQRGWVKESGAGRWTLTPAGLSAAEQLMLPGHTGRLTESPGAPDGEAAE